MRVHIESASPLIRLLQKYRPCPACGSDRVTVRSETDRSGSEVLRVSCSDCDFAREVPALPESAL
jgi:hypothetical protein